MVERALVGPLDALDALPPDDAQRMLRDELLRRDAAKRNVAPFAKYLHDPVGFARHELAQRLWWRQEELLTAVDQHQLVMVASGQKTGKTRAFGGILPLWWMATRVRGKVLLTSGNADQVKLQLWAELSDVCASTGILDRIGGHLNRDPSRGLILADGRMIVGLTARDKERMAGYSGDELLVIVDEASGFDDDLWKAIRGNLLGGAHAVAGGNPTRTTGWHYGYFTTSKSEAYTIRMSSRETPNYVEGRKVIPGLAERSAVDKIIREYGEGSAEVQIRVDGQHATQSSNSVVHVGPLEAAVKRWSEQLWREAPGRLTIGVDVARFGDDDSVAQPRRGLVAGPNVVVHGIDTVDLTGRVLTMARELRRMERTSWELPLVNVDVSGLGAGVFDQLARHRDLVEVCAADSSVNANERDKHHRYRDEMWWSIREWLAEGAALPPDPKRDEELLAPTYGFDAEGRTLVESKDAVKKRLKRSPDRGDALGLSIARGQSAPRAIHIRGL